MNYNEYMIARNAFIDRDKDPNPHTPDVVEYGTLRKSARGHLLVYELTTGEGDCGQLYGVSILRIYPDGRTRWNPFHLARAFHDAESCIAYIDRLNKREYPREHWRTALTHP